MFCVMYFVVRKFLPSLWTDYCLSDVDVHNLKLYLNEKKINTKIYLHL